VREIFAALRALGFERSYVSRAGGAKLVVYDKDIDGRRTVDVQLWGDGMMRASSSFKGCSDTAPTEFTDLPSLRTAIEHESTRMDGKYSQPGSLAAEQIDPDSLTGCADDQSFNRAEVEVIRQVIDGCPHGRACIHCPVACI
jgi:hypothetical protein